MSVEKSFAVNLKMSMTESGSFESIRILKGRSKLPEDVLDRVNKALQESLVPLLPVKTTVAIGDIAEQKIMNHLLSISKVNTEFGVIDTSSQTGHGDIAVLYKGRRICVEVKNYAKAVPMKEIDKYHNSLQLADYDAGVIIQVGQHGYCVESDIRTPIDIKIHNDKPSAYLTAIDLEMLYPILNMLIIHTNIECSIDQSELDIKRKALLDIHDRVLSLRTFIEAQKKTIAKMEASVEDIAKLSLI